MRQFLLLLSLFTSLLASAQTNNEIKNIAGSTLAVGNGINLNTVGTINTISVNDNTSEQKVRVYKNGSIIGIRRTLNLIEGSGVTMTVADDGPNDRVNITLSASGGAAITLTTTGSSGAATLVSGTLNIPVYTIAGLGGEASIAAGTTAQYWRGDKTWQTLDKTAVGLSNVPNTDATNRANHTGTQAWGTITGTPTTIAGYGITNNYDDDEQYRAALEALGSTHKAYTVGQPLPYCNTTSTLTDAQIRGSAIYLSKPQTLTGIKLWMRTAGAYTGDAVNGVALYSYSAGTLTKVAESANTASLWTATANAFITVPFSATYTAQPGIYFACLLYNNSAQTTAPAVATGIALNNGGMATQDFTNSAKLYFTINTQTTLPASIAMSSTVAATAPTWMALY